MENLINKSENALITCVTFISSQEYVPKAICLSTKIFQQPNHNNFFEIHRLVCFFLSSVKGGQIFFCQQMGDLVCYLPPYIVDQA